LLARNGGVCELSILVEMYLPFIPESESTPARNGADEDLSGFCLIYAKGLTVPPFITICNAIL